MMMAAKISSAEPYMWKSATYQRLPYRLLIPEGYNARRTWPLVVALHGAGERGLDNGAQLKNGVDALFTSDGARSGFPAFVLAPQCPKDARWVEVDWGALAHELPPEPSAPMAVLMRLLDDLQTRFRIDNTRIYAVGLSMGGYGVWDLLARDPDRFAAAVAICGGADLHTAPAIASIPMWVFHGRLDTVVPVTRSRSMVLALRRAGGTPRYTEYLDVGHNAWERALREPELLGWLFAQHR